MIIFLFQGKTGTKSFFGSFGRAKNKSSTYQDKSDSDNERLVVDHSFLYNIKKVFLCIVAGQSI